METPAIAFITIISGRETLVTDASFLLRAEVSSRQTTRSRGASKITTPKRASDKRTRLNGNGSASCASASVA